MTNTPPNTSSILIFDSGIGGLSIVDEISKALPNRQLIYVADNRLYPYGTLSEDLLLTRAKSLFPVLETTYQPALIIVACNSASTLILEDVRAITKAPIIGVVPAIKPAAESSRSGHIGLLATKGTITRTYTQELIDQFAQRHTVTKVGSDVLVAQAENKVYGKVVDVDAIRRELTPFTEKATDQPSMDTVILGCTHFPLIKEEISSILGPSVTLIDSGEAIARRTIHILGDPDVSSVKATPAPKHTFIFTAVNTDVDQITPSLQSKGFTHIQIGNH